jgi:hypothetical protein
MKTLIAFGLGALAMYYFDPQQGRTRRALARDKLTHAETLARREALGKAKDLKNRAQGAVAELT